MFDLTPSPATATHSPAWEKALGGEVDFVAVDTETTGLPWYERMVELGAVRFRGGRVVARWRTLVDPQRPIPERVTAIHGITDAHVVGAPDAREALLELQRFCDGALLLAHNAVFDRDILATECARAGVAAPIEPMYCTLRLARHCIKDAPRYGLAALAAHLRLPADSPHRALADAELTRQLFLECCARFEGPCSAATLDTYAAEGNAPWSLRGAVRRVHDVAAHLQPLRRARALGAGVTLMVSGAEGEPETVVRGVPRVLYARGDEGVVDLRVEGGAITSVPFARIARIVAG